jgi:crossover junction endodeoxyribonuclease RuvC
MKLLAIDPGYDRCGVAVIESAHESGRDSIVRHSFCIETNKKDPHQERLAMMYRAVEEAIDTWQPDALAVETLFFSVNKTTAMKVAEARGAILVLAGMRKIPLVEVSPQEVKLSMTGVGNANKAQVQKMVALTLKLDLSKKLDDEVDAIALGIAAIRQHYVDNLKKGLAKRK